MKKTIIAAALGVTLLVGGVSFAAAQDAPPPPGGGMLMRADNNHDGIITRDELLADVAQRFAKMDANHDGKITIEERDAARQAMMARRGGDGPAGGVRGMRRTDGNGDGSVTLDQQRAQATRRFDMIDGNHDGKIDQAEQETIRSRMMARGDRRGPPPGDMPPPADAPKAPSGK